MIAITKANLRVRLSPTTDSETIGVVQQGQPVDVIEVVNKWAKVPLTAGGQPLYKVGSKTPAYGYMSAAYLTFDTEPEPEPPPPVVIRKALLAINAVKSGPAGRAAVENGAEMLCVTFNPQFAGEMKDQYPHLIVSHRARLERGFIPTLQHWIDQGWQSFRPGMILTGLNEGDQSDQRNLKALRERLAFDKQCLEWVQAENIRRGWQANPMRYAAGGWSVGEPDLTQPEICDMLAEWKPLIRAGALTNVHTYSANDGRPGITNENIRDLIFDDELSDVEWRGVKEKTYRTDWTITRWRMMIRRCGWDVTTPIFSDETGLECANGSFPVAPHPGGSQEFVMRWARRFVWVQSQPFYGRDGKLYPSPFIGAALFQTGDDSWQTYEMRHYLQTLQACRWGQA
jgi:hypothetical protein